MKVQITVIAQKGEKACAAGHRVGDTFYIDEEWKTPAGLCCSAFTAIWPNARVLLTTQDKKYEGTVVCVDSETLLEFDLKLVP